MKSESQRTNTTFSYLDSEEPQTTTATLSRKSLSLLKRDLILEEYLECDAYLLPPDLQKSELTFERLLRCFELIMHPLDGLLRLLGIRFQGGFKPFLDICLFVCR